jgi:hypothetical protein
MLCGVLIKPLMRSLYNIKALLKTESSLVIRGVTFHGLQRTVETRVQCVSEHV